MDDDHDLTSFRQNTALNTAATLDVSDAGKDGEVGGEAGDDFTVKSLSQRAKLICWSFSTVGVDQIMAGRQRAKSTTNRLMEKLLLLARG